MSPFEEFGMIYLMSVCCLSQVVRFDIEAFNDMICNPSWMIRYASAQAPYLDENRTSRILPAQLHSSVSQTPTRPLGIGLTFLNPAKRGGNWIVKRIKPDSLPFQVLSLNP